MALEFRTRDLSTALNAADSPRANPVDCQSSTDDPLRIALVNNMPDSALEDTEAQFVELLGAAAAEVNAELSLYSIPSVPRGDRAQKRLNEFYFGLPELLNARFDGVIITGTEPKQPDLRNEPYWNELATVMDWAEESSLSAILSCLAAHAGVLHSDGISRRRLEDKRFGVFAEAKIADHPLTDSVSAPICFPHSRWNDLPAEELIAGGYTILTRAENVGVGLFVKEKKESLFVHFQGHPEYGERTIFKEYRRDVRRFLVKERETYPSLPHGYFDAQTEGLLNAFRAEALEKRSEEMIQMFPGNGIGAALKKTWQSSSVAIYRNWLQYITAKRSQPDGKHVSVQAAGG